MEPKINPLAPHHLPMFVTPAGETDTLLVIVTVFLIVMVMFLGLLYFKLHALPEHMSHQNPNKMQFEIVAVLALLALFTHNSNFWFAALILAMIRFPDYETPLQTIANAMTRAKSRSSAVPRPVADVDAGPEPIADQAAEISHEAETTPGQQNRGGEV